MDRDEMWRVWDWNCNDYFYSSEYLARNKCINLIVDAFPNPQTPREFEEREKCFEELEEYQCVFEICGYEKVGAEDEEDE